jgi:hypothetical protein
MKIARGTRGRPPKFGRPWQVVAIADRVDRAEVARLPGVPWCR